MLLPNNNRKPKHDRMEKARAEFQEAKRIYDIACDKFGKSFANYSKLHEEDYIDAENEKITFHVPTMPDYLVDEDLNVFYPNGDEVLTCGPHDSLPAEEKYKPLTPADFVNLDGSEKPMEGHGHEQRNALFHIWREDGTLKEFYSNPNQVHPQDYRKKKAEAMAKVPFNKLPRFAQEQRMAEWSKGHLAQLIKKSINKDYEEICINKPPIPEPGKPTGVVDSPSPAGNLIDGEEDDTYHLVKAAESLKKVGITLSIKVEKP